MPAGMPKAYYAIVDNIKAKWEKTGEVAGKYYPYWDKHTSGDASHRAHQIAMSTLKQRSNKKDRTNQELLASLDAYYKKAREIESFNHPDYKHVHENYDEEN